MAPEKPPESADSRPPPLGASAVLTHHWLVRRRGGEKVLEALRLLLPDSPIYTLVYDKAGTDGAWSGVHGSWLRLVPGARRHYPKMLALLAIAARTTRLPDADLVVCSDAAMAKAMRPHPRSRVVCYCHSPMRYVWDPDLRREYERSLPLIARPVLRASAAIARRVDAAGARRVDRFIANSAFVAQRIRRFYGRESVVIHPPVELPLVNAAQEQRGNGAEEQRNRGAKEQRIEGAEGNSQDFVSLSPSDPLPLCPSDPLRLPPSPAREDFYLFVGHNAPYKRLDLAVAACRALRRRLVVIGEFTRSSSFTARHSSLDGGGPQTAAAGTQAAAAGPQFDENGVAWLGYQPDAVLHDHYRRARGLLFPGVEDFGLIPVEAMARGCPVIAYGVGGACETVSDGRTGVLFSEQNAEGLAEAILRAESIDFDAAAMRAAMERFGLPRFLREMRAALDEALR